MALVLCEVVRLLFFPRRLNLYLYNNNVSDDCENNVTVLKVHLLSDETTENYHLDLQLRSALRSFTLSSAA